MFDFAEKFMVKPIDGGLTIKNALEYSLLRRKRICVKIHGSKILGYAIFTHETVKVKQPSFPDGYRLMCKDRHRIGTLSHSQSFLLCLSTRYLYEIICESFLKRKERS